MTQLSAPIPKSLHSGRTDLFGENGVERVSEQLAGTVAIYGHILESVRDPDIGDAG